MQRFEGRIKKLQLQYTITGSKTHPAPPYTDLSSIGSYLGPKPRTQKQEKTKNFTLQKQNRHLNQQNTSLKNAQI